MLTNNDIDEAVNKMKIALKWRKSNAVREIKESDFPYELHKMTAQFNSQKIEMEIVCFIREYDILKDFLHGCQLFINLLYSFLKNWIKRFLMVKRLQYFLILVVLDPQM